MLGFGFVVLGALTFLVSPSQTNATVRVGPSDNLLHKGVIEPCITSGVMAGTAACRNITTDTGRFVGGREKVVTGTELGVGRLAREVAPLKVDPRAKSKQLPDASIKRPIVALRGG